MTTREIRELLNAGAALRRGADPCLTSGIDWLAKRGEALRVLPGTYVAAQLWPRADLAARAAVSWNPQSLVTGSAAAAIQFRAPWSGEVEILIPGGNRLPPPFVVHRGRLDPELVVDGWGMRLTSPAATAVWLAAADGGECIDRGLRLRAFNLAELERAQELMKGRVGSRRRQQVIAESRDEPWSPAERRAHQQLRRARITGWRTNHWVCVAGMSFPIDIAFVAEKIAIEIDGREFHSSRDAFERDRAKANALVIAGWIVLRVTWAQLDDPTYLPNLVKAVMGRRLRQAG